MNTNNPVSFQDTFEALTGHWPFPWQEKLYARLLAGEFPSQCDVPTGLGKTSAIAVWIAALGASLSDPSLAGRVPRRLIYVVDRRVVVDQATAEVEGLRDRLAKAETSDSLALLRSLVGMLANSATVPDPAGVTVSTLRGKFADNHAWHLDPSRPAIVVGTVDMIGSRLLFSGYGVLGRNWRSLQAGLLVQDAWLVLDEAHLAPAFEAMLNGVERQQARCRSMRPFGVTRMSATLAPASVHSDEESVQITEPLFTKADEDDERVSKRFLASKTLRFVIDEAALAATKPADEKSALAERMCAEAIDLAKEKPAIVVFANTIEMVELIEKALKRSLGKQTEERVLALTGEMRGKERDGIAGHSVLAAFNPDRQLRVANIPRFLVATACVEVGMDFDADHAVCDLVALERMIQRFGRVNRRGETESEIRAVIGFDPGSLNLTKVNEFTAAEATSLALKQLSAKLDGYNASSAALRALDLERPLAKRAFTPPPVAPPLDQARLDDWSLTSLKADQFSRPQVSYWLRGVMEDDSVTTSLVWRADLFLAQSDEEAEEMIAAIPVTPREVAQVSTWRAEKLLTALAAKDPQARLVIRSAAGGVRFDKLEKHLDPKKRPGSIAFATVFLPVQIGGLRKGLIDASAEGLRNAVEDVVNREEWQRVVLTPVGGKVHAALISPTGDLVPMDEWPTKKEAIDEIADGFEGDTEGMLARCEKEVGDIDPIPDDLDLLNEGDDAEEAERPHEKRAVRRVPRAIAYFHITKDANFGSDEDALSLAKMPVLLSDHTRVAEAVARKLCEQLSLAPELSEAVALAARWHDRGKDRSWWQAAIGNPKTKALLDVSRKQDTPDGIWEPLAKSRQRFFDHSLNRRYRHEFGSLVEARADKTLPAPERELILHLIAAHHGHARPFFMPEAFDRNTPTPECIAIAAEVPGRFAALQLHYGWWSLAWLEALVKCADAIASVHPNWKSK